MPTPYELNLPCLNPNCHSHGTPHPNCRCYGFAEGGEVEHFCSESRMHDPGCQYFKDGGEAKLPSFDQMKAMESKGSEKLPSFDEMKKMEQPQSLPSFDEMKAMEKKPPTVADDPLEQLKAGVEGATQGLIGDAAKLIQVKTGISTLEDIERREQQYPVTHGVSKGAAFAGSLYAGPGRLVAAGAGKLLTSQVGAKLLGNALTMTSYATSDNISRAMLGQADGDVKSVVGATLLKGGMEGLMNTLTDGLFYGAPKAAKIAFSEKTIKAAERAMTDLANKPLNKLATILGAGYIAKAEGALESVKGAVGSLDNVFGYDILKKRLEPYIEKIIGRRLTKANEYVGDAVLNALAKSNFLGVPTAIRFADRMTDGFNSISGPLEALFKSGTHELVNRATPKSVESIEEWMENGGIDGELQRGEEEGFASGGEIKPKRQEFATLYPTENVLINEARGRVSNYLNSIRPSKVQSKLPFDSEHSNAQKKKSYKEALGIAVNPIGILNHLNGGTLTVERMNHFKSMWPEVHELLSSKITERITKAQLKGERPPYRKRQMISLFLGANLDSTFTPQAIASVQGLYAPKGQQPMAMPQRGGTPKALNKTSNQYQTDEQARERRMQNQKA